MPRAYTINKNTELTRLARRWWNEPGVAQRNAINEIMKIIEQTETLQDAALRVRAEFIATRVRIAADKKISYVSRHTIENMQARARIYRQWYTRFIEEY